MPAIQVAKTDTLEILRQKFNQLGESLFSISSGGSDLSAGNIKLGDGTRTEPSLAFTSDATLGIYKPSQKTFGFVSSGKKIADYSESAVYTFKDLIIQQNILTNSGLALLNKGSNYDAGTYNNVPLTGGTGDGATANITVTEFSGEITNSGSNYNEGSYTNVPLIGGSGSGATASFDVEGIQGFISNDGSGYIPGNYNNVPLINGSGTGATADIVIVGNTILDGNITSAGSGYTPNTYEFVQLLNKPSQIFTVTSIDNPNTPPPNMVYVVDGVIQKELTLIRGNTYRFDLSDSSNTGNSLVFRSLSGSFLSSENYTTTQRGIPGLPGSFVDLIIKPSAPNETIKYNDQNNDGMGANISIISGNIAQYGVGAIATITVNSTGIVSDVIITSGGSDYKENDILEIFNNDIGVSGSGFEFTLFAPVYTGKITSVNIQNNGQNYSLNDILSANNSNLGGVGSGFNFSINNNPGLINNLTFNSRGTNYTIDDILELPKSVVNLNTNFKGQVSNISTVLSNSSPIITISDTTGIIPGMQVFPVAANVGQLATGTTVLSVDSSTQITLSNTPTASGSAIISFSSSGDIREISVISTNGIFPGYLVEQISGTGILADDTVVNFVDSENNIIVLSQAPQLSGTAVVSFIPPFGDPSQKFTYKISNLGEIETYSIQTGGNGYSLLDQLSVNPSNITQPIVYDVINRSLVSVTFVNSIPINTFSVGDILKRKSGAILAFTRVTSPQTSGGSQQTFTNISSSTSGSGAGASFNVQRDEFGNVSVIEVNNSGYFYAINDIITISGANVGGSSPEHDIILEVTSVSSTQNLEIFDITSDGTNITSLLLTFDPINSGDFLIIEGTTTPEYEVDTASSILYRYFIDIGNGFELTPSFTLYAGSTYRFDLSDSSNNNHLFSLSTYRDGIWGPSLITEISTTLITTSNQITVNDATGILVGMEVIVTSGNGSLVTGTIVESVVGNTITLSNAPLSSGNAILTFKGTEYTDGVVRTSTSLTIQVTENTPNLYYYCGIENISHADEGGKNNQEALITIDLNNPKIFGSGFSLSVSELNTTDVITGDIETGNFTAVKFIGQEAELSQLNVTETLNASTITSNSIAATSITSPSNLGINATVVNVTGNFNIGSNIQVVSSSGNITTSGVLRTNGSLSVNGILSITNNSISTSTGNNILLVPPTGRVAKVNATTALTIPSGTSAQRPAGGIVENGSIRFNTDTNQYEGYSAATLSWSSLGGVRDLDGNTYISAEAFTGANDNTLYFYNDGNNTVKLNRNYLDFNTVKKLRSLSTSLPSYVEWTANTPVTLGSYVKYRNNIYEVTQAGSTGSSGNEPVHTTGTLSNGTAQLAWSASAVAPLTFEEIEELRVGPLGNLPLVVNSELRFANNVISTDIEDLVIRPNSGKKVTIDAASSLVIPVGDNNNRGVPLQGSIRYNTAITQFEGYNGVNWTSLGGVKDVDGNTYIIPETSPGANENILYFYNDGNNTLQLSTSALEFRSISKITSNSESLDLDVNTLSFNNFTASLTTTGSSTYLSSTQTNLDFGLSVGITNNYLLRLNTSGDIIVNKGFGTSVITPVKVLDNELKDFELDDVKTSTFDISLVKGTTNSGSSVVYSPSTACAAKVIVSAHNTTTNDKEIIEFTVTDKGSDIFNTEIGNVKTGSDLISPAFDFDASNNVRLVITLDASVSNGETVNITVVRTIIKK